MEFVLSRAQEDTKDGVNLLVTEHVHLDCEGLVVETDSLGDVVELVPLLGLGDTDNVANIDIEEVEVGYELVDDDP